MSPGVESTEGHGQLEDELTEGSDNRLNKMSSSRLNGMNGMNGMNEALNHSGEIRQTKRVAFRDVPPLSNTNHPPPPPPPSNGPQHNSYEKINGMPQTQQPMLYRSYTYDQGDFPGQYMEGSMNMKRTVSFNQGRPMHPQLQFSTFPGTYPMAPPSHHQLQQQQQHCYSLPADQHRLPRVHRGMGYDNNMVPPMVSPPYHQAPPPPRIIQQQHQMQHPIPRPPGMPPQQQSAFQRVPKQGSFRMQQHHQYENVLIRAPYYPTPPSNSTHPPQDHHQQKQPHQSYGGKSHP